MKPTASSLCLIGSILIAALAGCAAQQPMTVSEFKGFCYQAPNGREKFCDNIRICDEYLTVLEAEQPSQAQCLAGCQEVLKTFVQSNPLDGCDRVSYEGQLWCQRYCRENYPTQTDAPPLAGKPTPADAPAQAEKSVP